MRRLIAHIGLALTALVLVGTTYNGIATSIDSNIEYSSGKEMVFRVSPNIDASGDATNETDFLDSEANDVVPSKIIAEEMEKRLIASNVTQYRIVTEALDTVKVSLAQNNDDEYEKLKTYLSFNGSFALTTSKDTVALGEEFLTDEKAYLDDINGFPTVVIPFNNDSTAYQAVYEEAKQQKDDGEGESSTDSEGNEVTNTFMYMWYDYIEGYDVFSKTVESNEDYDSAVAAKILMKFNIENPYFPKENDDEANKLCATMNIDADGDSAYSPTEIRNAYETARYFVNLLNAEALPYHVEFIYSRTANLWIDEVNSMGTHLTVAWSNTFKAILICIAIIALLLAVFYRFGSISVTTISIVAAYLAVGVLALLKAELSVAAVIAIGLVAIGSVASGIVYLNKIKEECYKGRSIKKANSEAFKRSILPIVDIHVVEVLIGVFAYILGGAIMRSFAAVLVIAGIASLVLNTLGLGAMMWLATNATYSTGRYEMFGVSKDQVPDLMNEEKQKFFGAYSDKDFTAKKKPVGIVAAVLFVAALAGMIVSGVMNKGIVYRQANTTPVSEVYLEMETTALNNDILEATTRDQFATVAEQIKFGQDAEAETLAKYVEEGVLYNRTDIVSTKGTAETIYYSYYVVTLTKAFTGNETVYTTDINGQPLEGKLSEILSDEHIDELGFDSRVALSMKQGTVVSKEMPKFDSIMLATFVGVAAAAVYCMLRYRLSRGIATLLSTCAVGGITAGLFAVIPFGVGSSVVLAVPAVCLITLIIEIMFMNKEREIINEDKKDDKSVEHRNEIMVQAGKINFTPLIIFGAIAVYFAINFFGFGPTGTAWLYLNILFGIAVGGIFVACLYGPIAQIFYKLFSGIKIDRPAKKAKKQVAKHKSAEPEEAVFIGIND